MNSDTICAVATPPGAGGVGIIRLSGPDSLQAVMSCFVSSVSSFKDFKPYVMHHGRIADSSGNTLDEVLAVFMPGPGSYTGEDTVEINCHGGRTVLASVLSRIMELGPRQAMPGEFTKRAFLNGKLDLTQAEAVAELIAAPGKGALNLAQARLGGGLGRKIEELRGIIKDICAKVCLAVDFPEDDLECLPLSELVDRITLARGVVDELLQAFERTKAWREGALVVIAGEVNAGKSSLLNNLVGKNRAIVTDIPGTTRDYLEEGMDLGGLPVRLVDTAGLRATEDKVELAGLEIGKELAERADLVLLVVDLSAPVPDQARALVAELGAGAVLAVANKTDLPAHESDPEGALTAMGLDVCRISAKTGDGVHELARMVRTRILGREREPDSDDVAPNARQADALRRADGELESVVRDADLGVPYDLLGAGLDQAMACLDEITGRITPQEVLNDIFDNFCIGK